MLFVALEIMVFIALEISVINKSLIAQNYT